MIITFILVHRECLKKIQRYKSFDSIPKVSALCPNFKSYGTVYFYTEGYHAKRHLIYGKADKTHVLNSIDIDGFLLFRDSSFENINHKYAKIFNKPEEDFCFPMNSSLFAKKESINYKIYLFFNFNNNVFFMDVLSF